MENLDNTTDDVIIDQVEPQAPETTGDVIAEEQVDLQPQEIDNASVKETPESRDDYWKNKSYELDRKLNNLTAELPKIIEDNIVKATSNKQQEKKYSIAELEAYAIENPEHRPWVEEQKESIRKEEWAKMLRADKEEQQKVFLKQQVEARVLSNPKYADAFVKQGGQTLFNPQSELAQRMHSYMNDSRLNSQPDALEIAAKLAYADYIDNQVKDKEVKITNVKRQNAVLKQKTMADGGGTNDNTPVRSEFDVAKERLAKTGNRKDAEAAIKAYFARREGK
jgi:hypothetical protein